MAGPNRLAVVVHLAIFISPAMVLGDPRPLHNKITLPVAMATTPMRPQDNSGAALVSQGCRQRTAADANNHFGKINTFDARGNIDGRVPLQTIER